MSITLVSEPVTTDRRITSDVEAIESQALFEFKREDHACTFSDNGGKLKITISGDVTSSYSQYDSLYVGDDSGVYSKVSTIRTAPTFAAGDTTFDMELDYVSSPAGGYLNNLTTRSNYRVDIQVWNNGATTQLLDETFEYVPKQEGTVKPDLSNILLFLVETQGTDNNLIITPKYREAWTGNEAGAYSSATEIHCIFSHLQISTEHGANMLKYLLMPELIEIAGLGVVNAGGGNTQVFCGVVTVDTTANYTVNDIAEIKDMVPYADGFYNVIAKTFAATFTKITFENLTFEGAVTSPGTVQTQFLSKLLTWFDDDVKWIGWKRTASFIIDQAAIARTGTGNNEFTKRIISLDINKANTTNLSNLRTGTTGIIQVDLEDDSNRRTGYCQINILDNLNTIPYSESQNYEYIEENVNPVMLEWLNELGAYEQSLFMFDQEFTHEITGGLNYTAPITDDYSTITATKKRERVITVQKIALERSHLTLSQLRALQYIKQSKEVYIWLKKDGTSRIRVVVLPGITSFFSTNKLYDFALTVELPDNFDFYKAKEY